MGTRDELTVYVVDDDDAVRDSLKALLEAEDIATQTFPSCEDFLDHFHPSGSACLLLDVQIAGKDGIKFLETLGRREHHLPVIVMTGNGDRITKTRALNAGAAAFFDKPLDAEKLIDTIRNIFR